MPQLDITTYISQLFWLVICFSVMFAYISFVTVPRVRRILELRWDRIEGAKQKATDVNKQSETLKSEFDATLAKSRKQANELVVSTINSLSLANTKRKTDVTEMMMARIQSSEAKIERQKEKASTEMKVIAEDTTSSIFEKLLGARIKGDDIRKCMQEIIEQKVA